MIVVSDTSPLNYLILIEAVEVLPALFGEVMIPPAVREEFRHARTPKTVRQWTEHAPEWLRVQAPSRIDHSLKLDPGETEALSLAHELNADHLLIDERAGTKAAEVMGLRPISTLAVLAQAAQAGLIDLREKLNRLQSQTSFRVTKEVIEHLLAREN